MPVTMLVNDVSKMFHGIMRGKSEQIGLKNGYRQILFHLSRGDFSTQHELVRESHLSAPTVSVALVKMEQEGLVTRVSDDNDARAVRVSLTERGRELDQILKQTIASVDKSMTDCLDEAEKKTLKSLLWKMRESVISREDLHEKD